MRTCYATRKAFTFVHLLIVLSIIGALLCLIVPAILQAREAARASSCIGHMCQMQLALLNYEAIHGNFPAAFEVGPDGQAWHSWRVKILPLLDSNYASGLYEQYRFDEPWNSLQNSLLADKIYVEWFQCPSGVDSGQTQMTNYAIVTGPNTVFPGSGTTKLVDISDGVENTILLVETHDGSIHWMEPRDVHAAMGSVPLNGTSAPSISSPHPAGPGIGFAYQATSIRRLSPFISPQVLYELSTIAGGKAVTQDSLLLNHE